MLCCLLLSGPPTIYPFSIERGVQIGERVGLQCLVTKGDAPLTFRWLKDETPVSDLRLPSLTVTSVGEFSSTLLVESVNVEHGGTYTCEVRNAAATTTHSVHLAVNGTSHSRTALVRTTTRNIIIIYFFKIAFER